MSDETSGAAETALAEASEVVHQRSRLAILAALYELGESEFAMIRRVTHLSDGNLSRHLSVLEEAELVRVRKGHVGRRPRTWLQLTRAGIAAFEQEIQILRAVVAGAESASAPTAADDPPSRAKRPKRGPAISPDVS